MYYECPFCHSKKKPKIINPFPPKVAQCIDCYKSASEREFLKEDQHFTMPIHYYH